MPVDPNLLDMYLQTVDREPVVGVDANNEPVYGPVIVGEVCKIVQKQVRVESDSEEGLFSSSQIHYPEEKSIDARDKITLPAPFKPSTPKILFVAQETGLEPGVQHTVVML